MSNNCSKPFSNDIVEKIGKLKTTVESNDWKIPKAKITAVADGFRPILGRDWFDQLGKRISQKNSPKTAVKAVEAPCVLEQSTAKQFPDLITRIEKSKHHMVNSSFHKNYHSQIRKEKKFPFVFNRK